MITLDNVELVNKDNVTCITDKGIILKRKTRKHTKEVRELRKQNVYCFEIKGNLYFYKFDNFGNGTEYIKPIPYRNDKIKNTDFKSRQENNTFEINIKNIKHEVRNNLEHNIKDVQHKKYNVIKTLIQNNIPVYLFGKSGTGKNYTLESIAWDMGLEFYTVNSIQQEYKLTGFIDANGMYHETEFYKAFKYGGLFFLDELDASIPEVLVLLNMAIGNRYFEFPNGKIYAHENFRIVSAGNTSGNGADEMYTGRTCLDSSTLDRFCFVEFDYDRNIELYLTNGNGELVDFVRSLRKQSEENGIKSVFSYRCLINIIKLEKTELKLEDIFLIALFKGMDIDTINCFVTEGKSKYDKALKNIKYI